ncbi:sterol carrier family protein [Streptomyces sp. NPDC004610]|uniref:maleylpyruvate isomerase family mycothiol-dependent enzyme n=1 Tax=unclassified Streptomyces TaxID=2593676 RepID=UPI0033B4EF14
MPPAGKRPRAYDHARTRAAVLAQFRNVREGLRGLDGTRLALPTRLGDWTARDLAAHLALTVTAVARALDRPEPDRAGFSPLDYAAATGLHPEDVADAARRLAAAHPGPDDLDALYAATEQELTDRLDGTPATRLIEMRVGTMTLTGFLVTRTVELVVHTDDLNAAVPGLDISYDRQALAACTRLLADTLAAKAPGGSTEVRVPPFAVVQCVAGPRHTRGTPPNVVETDPLTWVRLAAGRLSWADARTDAKVSASGERSDLSALLPLLG